MNEELIEIGYTRKFHGLKGQLKLAIQDEYLEDFAAAKVLFVEWKGRFIPHFVENIRMGSDIIIQFEEINSREKALEMVGKTISIRKADLIPDEQRTLELETLEYAFLKGFIMQDEEAGRIGEILRIEEFPQQEMAFVEYQDREIMIPLNEFIISEILEKEGLVKVVLPDGLLNM